MKSYTGNNICANGQPYAAIWAISIVIQFSVLFYYIIFLFLLLLSYPHHLLFYFLSYYRYLDTLPFFPYLIHI